MRIFLDACALIYRFEGAAPFREAAMRRVAELSQRHPKAVLAASRLSVLECRVRPMREGRIDLLKRYDDFLPPSS